MSNHDPIRAALERLVSAADELEADGFSVLPEDFAAARTALATPPAKDEPAVPQEGREPAAVVPDVRGLIERVARMADRIGLATVKEIMEISDQAAAWLQKNPPGHPTTPAPVEGEVGELEEFLLTYGDHVMDEYGDVGEHDQLARAAALLQQQATELATLRAGVQVPVVKRPRGQPGWCDAEGRCWMGYPGGQGFIRNWRFCRPEDAPHMTSSLPHWAIPTPQPPQGGEVKG